MSNPSKSTEERVGILEQGKLDCQKGYDREFEELRDRVGRVESWKDKLMLMIIVILLGVVGNIILSAIGLKK